MRVKERIFHAVLFEMGAMIVGTLAVMIFGGNAHTAFGLSIAIAVVAMLCNFTFNWLFDKVFTGKREERSPLFRLFHTISFEATLLLATVPMVAYALDLNLWQAFLADISLTLIVMIYAFLFNWIYDHARLRFVKD